MLNLYNKDFTTKYGAINSIIEAFVEEERNGLFELSFVMLNTDSLFKYIEEDSIVVANANNTLVNQKFRIYMTRKLMNNRVEVFARHISFDLMYDYIDSISFENQSCEYALNSLFRGSQFSKHYKGYSDIINAQNYSMSMVNVLEAIGGKEGSILDTFGNGAELLRDNENIHILNKRGHDNSVTIEYRKNLTGFELEEDTTDLVTRILPYAKGENDEIVKASFVDSPLIANYSHPFVKAIDYSDKFEEGEEVTTSKLIAFAQNEYKVNKVDIPKQNFKIEFIPLSKCVGYEGLEDNISLCDTVTIKDTRYNIDTQAKAIKVVFNVLKNRYESMELGEPKTSLGDIIGNNNSTKGEKGDKGDKGDKGEDGSIGDFPNTLPATPIVTAKVYGFANIEISWTFENKVYYQYEVYASKEANFTPNTFNLVHKGQTSTYMYQAKPSETWYFKVCAINSHGERTDFGYAYATTTKISDLSNYVGEMAIGDALIGELNLGRGWVGELKGNYIDAKQLSVTDGNGKRTLDIDSFGNVNLDVTELKISSKNVATENYIDGISLGRNFIINSGFSGVDVNTNTVPKWIIQDGMTIWSSSGNEGYDKANSIYLFNATNTTKSLSQDIYNIEGNTEYVFTINISKESNVVGTFVAIRYMNLNNEIISHVDLDPNGEGNIDYTFITPQNCTWIQLLILHKGANESSSCLITVTEPKLAKGNKSTDWASAPEDTNLLYTTKTEFKQTTDSIQNTVSNIQGDYVKQSQFTQTVNNFEFKFDSVNATNLVSNGNPSKDNYIGWSLEGSANFWLAHPYRLGISNTTSGNGYAFSPAIHLSQKGDFSISFLINKEPNVINTNVFLIGSRTDSTASTHDWILDCTGAIYNNDENRIKINTTIPDDINYIRFRIDHNGSVSTSGGYVVWFGEFMLIKGHNIFPKSWYPNNSEVHNNKTTIDSTGLTVSHNDGSYSKMSGNGFEFFSSGTSNRYHNLIIMGEYACNSEETRTITLPNEFKGKPFKVITAIKRIKANYDLYAYKFPLLSFYAQSLNTDTNNGTFQIYASVRAWNQPNANANSWGGLVGDNDSEKSEIQPVVAYWVIA